LCRPNLFDKIGIHIALFFHVFACGLLYLIFSLMGTVEHGCTIWHL